MFEGVLLPTLYRTVEFPICALVVGPRPVLTGLEKQPLLTREPLALWPGEFPLKTQVAKTRDSRVCPFVESGPVDHLVACRLVFTVVRPPKAVTRSG